MGRAPGDRLTSDYGRMLRQRIAYVGDPANVDQLVDYLRSTYREYVRVKRQPFAKLVHEILLRSKNDNNVYIRKLAILRKRRKVFDESGDNLGNKKGLGGMSEVIWKLIEDFLVPLCRPEVMRHLGLEPMMGILLHGPPGCGKTRLAHAIANETRFPFYKISAAELVSGVSGAAKRNIRELFMKAYWTTPSVIFIDEIDVIASKTENLQREMERHMVKQLMTCMDESYKLAKPVNGRPGYILVLGATNRPDAIDPALRRPGRFDCEFCLGVPDEEAQVQNLTVLTHNLRVEGAIDLKKVAGSTPGYVGADLAKKARNLAMKRIINHRKDVLSGEYCEELGRHPRPHEEMENLGITMADSEMREDTMVATKDIWASRHESSVDYSIIEHFKRASLETISPSVPNEQMQVLSEFVEKLHM